MNKLRKNTGRTFRFPFDIDRRIFLILAAIFFVLAIKPINNFLVPRVTPEIIQERINAYFGKQQKAFRATVSKISIDDLYSQKNKQKTLSKYNAKSWSFYVLKDDSLIFWSKALRKPDIQVIPLDSIVPYSNQNEVGLFLKTQRIIANDTLQVIGQFPVYTYYKVENDLFKSHFNFLSSAFEKEDYGFKIAPISVEVPGRKTIKINRNPKFQIIKKDTEPDITDKNFWRFFLAAIPFIMFGVSIHTFFKVSVKDNPSLYFILLLLTVIVIRGMGYLWGFPDNFEEFYLFSTSLYEGIGLNISLGDLFINACLLFWIFFFYIMNVQNKVFTIKRTVPKVLFIVFCTLLLFGFAYISLFNIHSVVYDGVLQFDTTNYNNIKAVTIIGLAAMLLTFMNYVLAVIIFNRYFERYFNKRVYKYLLPLIGIVLSELLIAYELQNIMHLTFIWTSFTLFLLSVRFFSTKFDFNSYKLIYWLIFLSASCVMVIYYFDSNKEIKGRQKLVEHLINFENKETELKLQELGTVLKEDTNIVHIAKKDSLIEYITSRYLSSFDSTHEIVLTAVPLDLDSTLTITSLTKTYGNVRIVSNGYPSITFKNKKGEAYLYTHRLNHFILSLRLLPIFDFNNNINVQLIDDSEISYERITAQYKFAFYINNRLAQQSGIDNFPIVLPKVAQHKVGKVSLDRTWNTSDVIAHRVSQGEKKSIVIRREKNTLYKLSTTYAYIFTSIFLLMSLYILGNIVARSNLRRKRFINLLGLTLRMRIHLSILLVELISLSIIGSITILVLSNNTKAYINNNASNASKEITEVIQQSERGNGFVLDTKDPKDFLAFRKLVRPFLEKHDVGLNIYNPNGEKIYSTVSEKISNILPNLINPKAFAELKLKPHSPTLQEEYLGDLGYYTIYSNLFDKKGQIEGILEIPNYASKQSIRQNNSRIVTMLINIYAFVFLLSSLFAFYITKRLTNSFSKIVNQFSKINLTQTNEQLQWPYSDEIGLLIKEYNRTLVKLENSTALLAKSERELAWREMARQIAHEIKNPLTPMSLSLQSLQAAIKRNDPNVTQLTQKMIKTVLEQIKVLTRTASNFSEFATMTDIDARKESLIDILESTTGIYSDSDGAEFLFVLPKKDIKVHVDKVKLIRVLTNIIQNAIQSIPEHRVGQIMLTVTKQAQNFVDVAVQDNGTGIPLEFQKKVFEPNFTTKSSGSGLGLAMCKDIMTKTGGTIYFESTINEGSTFHILIPVFKEEED